MSVFSRKVRGFRLVDVVAAGLLVAIILSVYLAKTIAGRERTEIATVEKQIDAERDRIRLLQAEVAHLEQPSRIEQLSSTHLGMVPIPAKNEITPENLAEVAQGARFGAKPKPKPATVAVKAPMAAPQPAEAPAVLTPVSHVVAVGANQ